MIRRILCALTIANVLLFALPHHETLADDLNLPDSLRPGYVGPIDGPARNKPYTHGQMGLIRPTYGRASLYVAWRLMHLPVNALATESHTQTGDWLHGVFPAATSADAIQGWLTARSELVETVAPVAPDYFRHGKLDAGKFGQLNTVTGNCGGDAYLFAARTLNDLIADTSLTDNDRKAWVAGQDAVFARCSWMPGNGQPPVQLAALPAKTAPKVKALYAYQHAAALFYADDYTGARKEFDAIAAESGHPMHAWATLGSFRCIVRDAVRDAEWSAATQDAWGRRKLRGAEFNAAVAESAARHWARVEAALKELNTRYAAHKGDVSIEPARAAIDYTMRRAYMQLMPMVPLDISMTAMDRPETNPYTMGAMDTMKLLFPYVSPDRPQGGNAERLRKHAWFDFVVTVQGCADIGKPANVTICDQEHAHATERWNATKDAAWMLAVLMTARQPADTDLAAASAARKVVPDRPEWASMQLYAARVLRANGRRADADAAVSEVANTQLIDPRDRAFATSAF